MRIIRGTFKSRNYKVPKNFPSRPTTDFAKEGLFNILENKFTLDGMEILDLCAGTGNISMEFLSREAGSVIAVDQNFNCVKHIKTMAHSFGCEKELIVIKSDILKFLMNTDKKFDIIFADPPFAYKEYEAIIETVFNRELLKDNGVLIIEHGKETSLETITHFDFMRKYGNVEFSFFL